MKILPSLILSCFLLLSCEDEKLPLNINKEQKFEGSFKLKTDEKQYNQSGTSTLEILNGGYKGYTYDGMVLSAGKLKVTASKITFVDTVFKAWPMHIIIPTYLKGTYDYAFDGNRLEIGNRYASGWIEKHTLQLQK